MTKKTRKSNKKTCLTEILAKSPINYFSDLFVATMVILWIAEVVYMTAMATYSTVKLADNSVWSEIGTLVSVPLTAGGAIWMVKNSVQHAIANQRGKEAHMDFPAVHAEGEDDGAERPHGESNSNDEVLG